MNADRIAALYRWIEYVAFGKALERRRFAFLSRAALSRRVLILGEGDGRFLARLLALNDAARVDVVDASGSMLALARGRVPPPAAGRVLFHRRNALLAPLPGDGYDLIVTHFFLDCFSTDDAARMIARLSAALRPGGEWIVSEFQEPSGRLARLHARLWLFVMYSFFRLATGLTADKLPPYSTLLSAAGLVIEEQQQARWGLMVSQLWRKPADTA
ncbi:MAG: class I SAM-dependent methyltransferase [Bryobacterales bacterium]|nr:class I SAM-dependent methyltransferase [Bryobacterales bacterium]